MDPNLWFKNTIRPEDVPDRTIVDVMNDRADPGGYTSSGFLPNTMTVHDPEHRATYDTSVMSRQKNKMSDLFLMSENIDRIQMTLADAIWRETGHKIERQPDVELVQVMRYVYNTYYPTIPNTGTCKPTEVLPS